MAMDNAGPAQVFLDPTNSLNLNDATPRFTVGGEVDFKGGRYIYVQHNAGAGVVATLVGAPAFWKTIASGIVTQDKTDAEQGAALPLGCAGIYQLASITSGNYTWLKKRGLMANVRLLSADSNGATGNKIFPQATDADSDLRSEVVTSISGSEIPAQLVGWQIGAGASNLATVLLQIL